MTREIEVYTLENLLKKTQERTTEKIYCTRIGKITIENNDRTFGVELLETIKYNNQTIKPFITSCQVQQNYTQNNGYVMDFKVGDYVKVQFTDVDYRQFFIDKNGNQIVFEDKDTLHAIDNGLIVGGAGAVTAPIKRGLFYGESWFGFDNDKLQIKSKTNNMKELFEKVAAIIDAIVALNGTIVSPTGNCTFDVSAFNSLKSELEQIKNGLLS